MANNDTLSNLLVNYVRDGDRYAVRTSRSDLWGRLTAPVTPLARHTAQVVEQHCGTTLNVGAQALIFPADGTPAQVVTLTADGWQTGDILL